MSRNRIEAVTGKDKFILLVHALPPLSTDGKATWMQASSTINMHVVLLDELKTASRRMSGLDAERFSALLALRGAMEAHDKLALMRAKERLERVQSKDKAYQSLAKETEKSDRWLHNLVAPFLDVLPELRRDIPMENRESWLFSSEVSRLVGGKAQIVLSEIFGIFRPAIYCFDLNTALYIHTFFIAPTGSLGFRVCPYDGKQFFQERPNQDYCCPGHRDAHRVARWRDQKKNAV